MRMVQNDKSLMLHESQRTQPKRHRVNRQDAVSATSLWNAMNRTSQMQTNYQNRKYNASALQRVVNSMVHQDAASLEQTKQAEGAGKLASKVEEFATYYNGMIWNLQSGSSKLDSSYFRILNSYAERSKEELKATGVTRKANGMLEVDTQKLQTVKEEQLQRVWGDKNSFAAKAGVIASSIQENAVSKINSLMPNSYSGLLGSLGEQGNFFNLWM